MTLLLEGGPTKAKEAPPNEIRLAALDINTVFQCQYINELRKIQTSTETHRSIC